MLRFEELWPRVSDYEKQAVVTMWAKVTDC